MSRYPGMKVFKHLSRYPSKYQGTYQGSIISLLTKVNNKLILCSSFES